MKHPTGLALSEIEGFTLIELVVVVGIIGVLAVLVLLAINPAELQRKGRDGTRMSDLTTIRNAIDLALVNTDNTELKGTPSVHFFADSSGTRSTSTNANWIGLNVSKFLSVLPNDPLYTPGSNQPVTLANGITTVTKDNMRYFFGSDGATYELNALLESPSSLSAMTTDGGDSNLRFETGTNPGLTIIVGP